MFGPARDRGWAWPVGMSALSAVPPQRSDQSDTRERSVWSQQPHRRSDGKDGGLCTHLPRLAARLQNPLYSEAFRRRGAKELWIAKLKLVDLILFAPDQTATTRVREVLTNTCASCLFPARRTGVRKGFQSWEDVGVNILPSLPSYFRNYVWTL